MRKSCRMSNKRRGTRHGFVTPTVPGVSFVNKMSCEGIYRSPIARMHPCRTNGVDDGYLSLMGPGSSSGWSKLSGPTITRRLRLIRLAMGDFVLFRHRHVWTTPADQGLFSVLYESRVRSCLRPSARE